MRRPALGQLLQQLHIAANESFFLGPTPPLEFSLGFNRVRDTIKPLRKDQFDRPSGLGISRERAGIVLRNSDIENRTRRTDIKAAVATFDDVEISSVRHLGLPYPSQGTLVVGRRFLRPIPAHEHHGVSSFETPRQERRSSG
jgi:hypothetical protein